MLKPALGELHCVGATTLDEYRNTRKRCRAGATLQKILVGEPTVATIAILRGLKERYEVHHGVDITDPASGRSHPEPPLHHRPVLPDKAIDLIDEAASKIKIELDSKPEVMDKLTAA